MEESIRKRYSEIVKKIALKDECSIRTAQRKIKKLNPEMKEKLLNNIQEDISFFEKTIKELDLTNLSIIIETIETSDCEDYVRKKFKAMGYRAIDCRKYRKGHPDFIFKKFKEKIYVEVKADNDGLRLSQLNWILNNKDKKIIIYFIIRKNVINKDISNIRTMDIPHSDKVKMISAEKECSIRTAQRYLKQQLNMIENQGL